MLRIISGRFRQKRLFLPDQKTTRPTTDRVREAVFNVLLHTFHIDFSKVAVLDVFAGSGSMGLEALSRGAQHVSFVEKDPKVIQVLEKNIGAFLPLDKVTVFKMDALKLGKAKAPVGLIFLDPPYQQGLIEPTVTHLLKQGWIDAETLICIESSKKDSPETLFGFDGLDKRIYGGSAISFWRTSA